MVGGKGVVVEIDFNCVNVSPIRDIRVTTSIELYERVILLYMCIYLTKVTPPPVGVFTPKNRPYISIREKINEYISLVSCRIVAIC